MKRVVVTGNVKAGKLVLLDQEGFRRELASTFNEDTIVDVIVERQSKKRSNKQNKYLWGVVYSTLAKSEIGYTEEEWHEMCKYKFLRKHYVVGDENIDTGQTTTKLTTAEFEEYTEKIRRWGAHIGVDIPEPNEAEKIFDTLNQELDLEKQK